MKRNPNMEIQICTYLDFVSSIFARGGQQTANRSSIFAHLTKLHVYWSHRRRCHCRSFQGHLFRQTRMVDRMLRTRLSRLRFGIFLTRRGSEGWRGFEASVSDDVNIAGASEQQSQDAVARDGRRRL